MPVEYWVTCALDPWPELEQDDAFGEIVDALRASGEYAYDEVMVTLEEAAPAFVPGGSVVLHVSGPTRANWEEVLELLDAVAAAGEGVVFAEDRQIVLDRRSVRPGVSAFKQAPAWAAPIVAWPAPVEVVVFGARELADPKAELARFGLAALAARIVASRVSAGQLGPLAARIGADVTSLPVALSVSGATLDALVVAQALAHAVRGRAFALGGDGRRAELPP